MRRQKHRLGRKQHECHSLIFVSGQPHPNEFLIREQQRYFPISFSYVHFAFSQCNSHWGFFVLGTEGEALQERRTNDLGGSPSLSSREFRWRYLCSALFGCAGVRMRLGGLQASDLSLPKFQSFLDFADYSSLKSQAAQVPFWAFSVSRPQFMYTMKVSAWTTFCLKGVIKSLR